MDPVTHTFFGASLGAAGLRRTSALATPTLILAANAPDVDAVTLAWGPYTSLALRRGLTHGLPALVVLPFVVTGAVLLWDRWIRRRRHADLPPPRPGVLLALAAVGVWSHPALDWLNTYGMRWLFPITPHWSYGDAVFIVDPWLWLLLGGAAFVAFSARRRALAGWGVLALVLSLPVLLMEGVPGWARLTWLAGLAGWAALRSGLPAPRRPRVAAASVALAALYTLVMVAQTPLAAGAVAQEARDRGLGPVTDVMVGPVPARPLEGQVIVQLPDAYWTGRFRWTASPRVRWDPEPVLRPARDSVILAAESHPWARRFLTWSRYPAHQVHEVEGGWLVRIRDVRYMGLGAGELTGVTIQVDRELRAHPAPPDSTLHAAVFDTVWTRIRDTHWDRELAGLDWEGARRELRPRAAASSSSDELRAVLRELLGRLGDSHFVLIPGTAAGDLPGTVAGDRPGTAAGDLPGIPGGDPSHGVAPGPAGDPGLELRWRDGAALVTRVRDGGPAAEAGVRPGDQILRIGDEVPAELIDRLAAGSPDEALPAHLASSTLEARLEAPAGERVPLELRAPDGAVRRTTLVPAEPSGEVVRFGHLPPFRLEVQGHRVEAPSGTAVGVIRFNGWFPAAAAPIAEAVDRFRGLDGIVLDLRGNPGGVAGLVMGVGGHFLDEAVELGVMRTRDTSLRFVTNPQRVAPDGRRVTPWAGPLAILVDELTGSTSELFAAGLQAVGRARVFGHRTAGQVLPAVLTPLPNGDLLMHAVADFTAPDGSRLEGRGVEPDEPVVLDPAALARGADPVLDAALAWIAAEARADPHSPLDLHDEP